MHSVSMQKDGTFLKKSEKGGSYYLRKPILVQGNLSGNVQSIELNTYTKQIEQ
jgi:hypothetical protein